MISLVGPYELIAWSFFALAILAIALVWCLCSLSQLSERITYLEHLEEEEEWVEDRWTAPSEADAEKSWASVERVLDEVERS